MTLDMLLVRLAPWCEPVVADVATAVELHPVDGDAQLASRSPAMRGLGIVADHGQDWVEVFVLARRPGPRPSTDAPVVGGPRRWDQPDGHGMATADVLGWFPPDSRYGPGWRLLARPTTPDILLALTERQCDEADDSHGGSSPSPGEVPDEPLPTYRVVDVPSDDVLNVRRGAGTHHPIVYELHHRATGIVRTGRVQTVDGVDWWEVVIPGSTSTGWASSRYLRPETGGAGSPPGGLTSLPSELSGPRFRTRDGGVECTGGTSGLYCEAGALSPTPAGFCDFDWAAIHLPANGVAEPQCVSDTMRQLDTPVLPPGALWAHEGFACVATGSSVWCQGPTGDGFSVSDHGSWYLLDTGNPFGALAATAPRDAPSWLVDSGLPLPGDALASDGAEGVTLLVHADGATYEEVAAWLRTHLPAAGWQVALLDPLETAWGYRTEGAWRVRSQAGDVLEIVLYVPQGSAQLGAAEEHGVQGPWIDISRLP